MKINLKFFRYTAYALEIILLAVLQSTPKLLPELFGGKAVLLLAAALSFSALENEIPALILGAVCGALADLSAFGAVGYFAISLTLICFVISRLFRTRLRSSLLTLMLLSLAAVPIIFTLYFLLFKVFAGVPDCGILFVRHYLSRAGLTYICVLPLYFLNKFLRGRLA